MSDTIAQWVAWNESQLGTDENPAGSNCQPYSHEMGEGCEEWCADFGCSSFRLGAGFRLPVESASCVAMYDGAQRLGLGIPSTQAQPGDSIIRTWQHLSRADLNPALTHYQNVVGRSGSTLLLIGGNQGYGVVSRDTVTAGDSSVLGALAWSRLFTKPAAPAKVITPGPKQASPSHLYPVEVMGPGSRGNGVTRLQNYLFGKGSPKVTGLFNAQTKTAVVNKQHGLKDPYQNGIVGPSTYLLFVKDGMRTA